MEPNNRVDRRVVSLSIGVAGWFVGNGFRTTRSYERFVTVKGLAERDVTADRAIWPIAFVATDDSLDREIVERFLLDHEIAPVQNVVLGGQGYVPGPSYIFSDINTVKPAMIAEATRNARAGADQLALDSGSVFGEIRRANQGILQILPAGGADTLSETSQIQKTIRAVVTIEFFLE